MAVSVSFRDGSVGAGNRGFHPVRWWGTVSKQVSWLENSFAETALPLPSGKVGGSVLENSFQLSWLGNSSTRRSAPIADSVGFRGPAHCRFRSCSVVGNSPETGIVVAEQFREKPVRCWRTVFGIKVIGDLFRGLDGRKAGLFPGLRFFEAGDGCPIHGQVHHDPGPHPVPLDLLPDLLGH